MNGIAPHNQNACHRRAITPQRRLQPVDSYIVERCQIESVTLLAALRIISSKHLAEELYV